jgi:GTP:adenosylcobinamide-phosphate guanylyltransferase
MIKHVIVHAGGKGSRMGKFSENKPKCLISIGGIPVLKSISIAFPGSTLHIIGDYKIEVLENYLETVDIGFKYDIIKAEGEGTNSGIKDALMLVPDGEQFVITWSDLFYTSKIEIPVEHGNYIFLTDLNKCRYSFRDGIFKEENTNKYGVIGLFLFKNKAAISSIPRSGEFVKFLSSISVKFTPISTQSVNEVGTMDSLLWIRSKYPSSRFFNNIQIEENVVIKSALDQKYQGLILDEISWYKFMQEANFKGIPKIISFSPLKMERIRGKHPHQLIGIPKDEKIGLVNNIILNLKSIHSIGGSLLRTDDMYNVYVNKTLERIKPVIKLLKLNEKKTFIINGQRVESLGPKDSEVLDSLFKKLTPIEKFRSIHGDPTFSNIFITDTNDVKFIDPRGYFGSSKIFGDPRYDFAKLYYSLFGNYDQFNSENFKITMNLPEVSIKIDSSQFEFTDEIFKNELKGIYRDIKILHAFIWLSLSGYVLNDYDSVIAAYFMGLLYLNGVLNE